MRYAHQPVFSLALAAISFWQLVDSGADKGDLSWTLKNKEPCGTHELDFSKTLKSVIIRARVEFFGTRPPTGNCFTLDSIETQKKTVLVIDDEQDLRLTLRKGLEADGFKVIEAADRNDALQRIKTHCIDIVTLDLGFGPDDGFSFARDLREQRNVPVILVTGRSDPQDRVRGLENGADDYITKPFHFREIVMRINQVLRRYELEENQRPDDIPEKIDFDHCVFDTRKRAVHKIGGDDLDLTETELRLLEIFVRRPGRVLSRDEISLSLRGQEWSPLDRTIDGHVARLRRKIEPESDSPNLIKSVRGVGYVFTGEVNPATATDA